MRESGRLLMCARIGAVLMLEMALLPSSVIADDWQTGDIAVLSNQGKVKIYIYVPEQSTPTFVAAHFDEIDSFVQTYFETDGLALPNSNSPVLGDYEPEDCGFDRDGNLYIAYDLLDSSGVNDITDDQIRAYAPLETRDAMGQPIAGAHARVKTIYTARHTPPASEPHGRIRSPISFVIDRCGNVYVGEQGNNDFVSKFDSDGQ